MTKRNSKSTTTKPEPLWRLKIQALGEPPMTELIKAPTGRIAVQRAKERYKRNPPQILLLGKVSRAYWTTMSGMS